MKNILLGLFSLVFFSLWSCDGAVSKYHLGAQFIGLQPYENVDTNHLNIAKEAIEDYYGYDVKILDPIKLPHVARSKKGDKYKYNADKLLIHLKQALPDDLTKIIGILDADIYARSENATSHRIVSKSERSGEVGVMSMHLIQKTTDTNRSFESRFKKLILKEIGHTLGLSNCPNEDGSSKCLMMNSKGIGKHLDRVDYGFCDECAQKLNWDDKALENSNE